MIITIIGSLKNREEMMKCKKHFERFGHIVNAPCDPKRSDMPLIEKQASWIKRICEADLVVAIHKSISVASGDITKYVVEFGESTSYELAIAYHFNKEVVFW